MALYLSSNILNKLASCMPVSFQKATSLSLVTFLHYVSLFSNSALHSKSLCFISSPQYYLSFLVPCLDIRLLIAVAISIVYPFLTFFASFVSTSPSILHYCSVVLNSQLSPYGFLLHLDTFQMGLKFLCISCCS